VAEQDAIPVRVSQVLLIDGEDQQYIQLQEVLPEESDRTPRVLTMVIGRGEAREISRLLRQVPSLRPLTHELLESILEKLGGELREVVIHDLKEHTFFAELRIDHQGGSLAVDCRPSDAVALSLLASKPIFATEKVLASPPAD